MVLKQTKMELKPLSPHLGLHLRSRLSNWEEHLQTANLSYLCIQLHTAQHKQYKKLKKWKYVMFKIIPAHPTLDERAIFRRKNRTILNLNLLPKTGRLLLYIAPIIVNKTVKDGDIAPWSIWNNLSIWLYEKILTERKEKNREIRFNYWKWGGLVWSGLI